jgi:beta-lactamase regulating signal transducer with metallopeptidase domain
MNVAVYLPLVIPVLAALAARPLADRLPPAAATWLLAASSLILALASSAVLGLLALSALVRVPFVDAVAHLSAPVINSGDSVSVPVAIIAGGLLAAVAAAAVRALWHRGGAIVAAHRRARSLPGAGQVVVTEDDAADAYTIPGWPCRIVITSGMVRVLSAQERQVLLAHERAHASGSHYLFTSVARLAAAANPLLRPVAAQASYTVERWADERAAAESGDRPLTARAVARAALAASAAPPDRSGRADPLTALGMVSVNDGLRGAGPVPRRVAALLAPPPRTSLLIYGAVVLVVALSAASALDAAASLHQLIELAQGSPD